jgi:hypothetical protein
MAGKVASRSRTSDGSSAASSAASRRSSSSTRAFKYFFDGHETMTPALMNSSRSTRGTTRMTA